MTFYEGILYDKKALDHILEGYREKWAPTSEWAEPEIEETPALPESDVEIPMPKVKAPKKRPMGGYQPEGPAPHNPPKGGSGMSGIPSTEKLYRGTLKAYIRHMGEYDCGVWLEDQFENDFKPDQWKILKELESEIGRDIEREVEEEKEVEGG